MAIGTQLYGASAPSAASGMKYFGGADYSAALSSGHTNLEILNWINSNFNKLSPGSMNQPGGGGLYDAIASSASQESQAAAQKAATEKAFNMQIQQQQLQEQAQAEKLKQLEISERVKAANTARSNMRSQFQIKSSSKSPETSGTQGFRRRNLQVNPSAYSSLASGAAKQSTLPGVLNI